MKKFILMLAITGLFFITTIMVQAYDYADAFEKGLWFFDANKCGSDAAEDSVCPSWRGACHTSDSDGSIDLTGGYHDAGDHVKFGIPQFWTAGVLGWIYYEYKSLLDREGLSSKLMSIIKRFTDFILKSHPSANVLYWEVGDGHSDHAYWGPPETQTSARPVKRIDSANPGTDVSGLASAALSIMYLNYKNINSSYANQCLQGAKELYNLAKNYLGQTSCDFYKSSSHYDDLAWAAVWLAIATGDNSFLDPVDGYLDQRNNYGDDNYNKPWAPAWDDVALFAMLKMAQLTENFKYMIGIENNLTWYSQDLQRTPGGLPWLDSWGVLRYAAAEAGLGFMASKLVGINLYNTTAEDTMDYTLGSNPRNGSYVTNYLSNPPRHPHHRANQPDKNNSFTNGMVGALVGGPNESDGYSDDVNDYTMNEVAIDYNASYLLGMAGMLYFSSGGAPAPSPVPPEHPSLEILYRPAEANNTSNQIKPFMKIYNPGPLPINLSEITIRYWFTPEGTGHEFYVDWAQMGKEHISGAFYDGYVEIGFLSSAPALKIGTDTGEMQIRVTKPDWSEYDQGNDYSFNPASPNDFTANTKITAYHEGVLIFGTEPEGPGSTETPSPAPTTPPDQTPEPAGTKGDVNEDGAVDIVDALLVAQFYVGLNVNINIDAADVNCDEAVDIVDALLIAQYYVGLIEEFC